MSEPWWVSLLREQQATRFADLAGTRAQLTLPISDRLVTRIVAMHLPPGAPVKNLELTAQPDDCFTVHVTLARPSFLPSMAIRLAIVSQPELPGTPVLVLRIISQGVAALAGPAMKFLAAVPAGIQVEGEHVRIDLRALLERYGAIDLLACLTELRLTTTTGRFVLRAQTALPPA